MDNIHCRSQLAMHGGPKSSRLNRSAASRRETEYEQYRQRGSYDYPPPPGDYRQQQQPPPPPPNGRGGGGNGGGDGGGGGISRFTTALIGG
eukprot:scaffold36304_cov27-Prasinocladus_malaysianus.AAC.1